MGPMTRIARESLSLDHIPTDWRGSSEVLIPKAVRAPYKTQIVVETVEGPID